MLNLPPPPPLSEVLNLAADILGEHKWIQGSGWWPEQGGLCLEGALVAAMGVDYRDLMQRCDSEDAELQEQANREFRELDQCPAYTAVRQFVGLKPEEPLYRHNDWASHKYQIIETLRGAAEQERLKEQASD